MCYPHFDYLLGESMNHAQLRAQQEAQERQARIYMEALRNWRPSQPQRKTQSGVPAIPLKKGSE